MRCIIKQNVVIASNLMVPFYLIQPARLSLVCIVAWFLVP